MLNETELIELVFEHLCEHQAEEVAHLKDEEIMDRARAAVTRARSYGFRKEASYAAFAGLFAAVGPRFDEQPAIRAALTRPGVDPDTCLTQLFAHTRETDWDAAGELR